jgi:hypothetical protein
VEALAKTAPQAYSAGKILSAKYSAAGLKTQHQHAMKSFLAQTRAVVFSAMLWGSGARAQISVDSVGSSVMTFDSRPPQTSWATKSITGSAANPETDAALDQFVNGLTNDAGTISLQVSNVTGNPPGANAVAMWTPGSANGYLITRPTATAVTLLMATLTNVSGGAMQAFNVQYEYVQKTTGVANEAVKGHRVYYSLTGAGGSWVPLGDFGNSFTTNVLQNILIGVDLSATPWPASSAMYLLFADDNANLNNDGANAIDNFAIRLLPMITNGPQSVATAPGSTVSFNVGASGGKPLFYQWLKNSNNIPNATNAILTLNTAAESDSGYYSVIVSNSAGTAISSNALLTVACSTPAGFVTQPLSQNFNSGDTLNLGVTTSGTAPITYQWHRKGVPIPGATNATYTQTNAQPTDSGFYYVVINNCVGTPLASSNVLVSVSERPYTLVSLTNHVWKYANENTNIDLGDAWKAIDYPAESTWPSGPGMFGVESFTPIAALINTPLILNHAGNANIVTHRLRTSFVFTNDPALVSLVFSNYIDDGAVVYLNSNELFRVNMPNGTVGFLTSASSAGPSPEGTFLVTNFPGNRVLPGTNVVVVEVHQSGTGSADVVFGMDIKVIFVPPTLLAITNQPTDVLAEEAKSAAFSVGVSGAPTFFQWFKDGVSIPGATSAILLLTNLTTQDAGFYAVRVSNVINTVMSRLARLDVVQDFLAPVLISAEAIDETHVLARFSDAVLPQTATNTGNYLLTNTVGGVVSVFAATMTANASNVLLNTATLQNDRNYVLTASGVADRSPHTNARISAVPVARTFTLIALDSEWAFFDPYPPFDDPDPGPNWRERIYDTSTWGFGYGAFGYSQDGTAVPPTTIRSTMGPTPVYAAYFRHTFDSEFSPAGVTLSMRYAVDDGAVFYLNGQERLRRNMPDGVPNPQTPAAISLPGYPANLDVGTLSAELLHTGPNLLAVELHQFSGNDADKFFAMELTARAESLLVGPVVVLSGPADSTVEENRSATFSVTSLGAVTFQWQLNDSDIPGATNPTLTIATAPLALDGARFRLVLGREGQFVTTSNATLHVRTDNGRPILLSAIASNNNTITIIFSEAVSAATATNVSNYSITTLFGATLTVTNAVVSGSNVVLYVADLPFGTYIVSVSNVRDASTEGNMIAPGSAVRAGYNGLLVPFLSVWRYDQRGIDNGTSWRATDFDDTSWPASNGLFYGRSSGLPPAPLPEPWNTVLSRSNSVPTDIKTYYFRTTFFSVGATNLTFTLRMIADDGAVFYLNGAEISRIGMGSGTVSYSTLATRSVGDPLTFEGPYLVTITNVVPGENVLAAEVHQVSAGSADAAFDAEITATMPSQFLPVPSPAPPPLRLSHWGSQLAIEWDDPAAILESAANVAGPWTTVNATSPFIISPIDNAAFYRLRK